VSRDRLPAHLEVASLIRAAQASGDFATILKKGDADRGALLLSIASRGRHFACLERVLSLSGTYAWEWVGPGDSAQPQEVSDFLARRTRFDEDMWIVELDIAAPERFIAETTPTG
jgi:hypothetical protein